VDDP